MVDQPSQHTDKPYPPDSPTAVEWLERGNQTFATPLAEDSLEGESFFTQAPFAAILACSDARLPVELVFNQPANRLFVVRLAGNVLSAEALGSLEFAVANLESVQLAGVVGHTGCGAVTAAVAAYLSPNQPLLSSGDPTMGGIVRQIEPAVRLAAQALEQAYAVDWKDLGRSGPALIDLAALTHAALTAAALQEKLSRIRKDFPVAYGIYHLQTGQVGQPALPGPGPAWQPGLRFPPHGPDQLSALLDRWATSPFIRSQLEQSP